MRVVKSAIFIRGARQILFIPAEKIERGCENIEGKVAFGRKKCLVKVQLEAFDFHWMNARLLQQRCAAEKEFRLIQFSI